MTVERDRFEAEIQAAQSGDKQAEQRLMEENLPLVIAIAKRFLNRGVESDDLKQLGSIGLLKAIRRFDIGMHVCFSTYAVPMIAGEIKRFLRDDGLIKFSRGAKQLAAAVAKALAEEPELTVEALALRLSVSVEEIAVAVASSNSVSSLDEPISDGSENRFDRIGSDSNEEASVNRLSLEDAMRDLSPRDRVLIRMRYREEKTQAEVGKVLGVSQVQVSRMEKKILSVLRNRMEC